MTDVEIVILSEAQVTALQVSGIDVVEFSTPEEAVLREAWFHPRKLAVRPDTRDAVWSALNDLSNAADERGDRQDARSLQVVGSKVLRMFR